jgi:hypothetical protein
MTKDRISGRELLSLFRSVGVNIRINTTYVEYQSGADGEYSFLFSSLR